MKLNSSLIACLLALGTAALLRAQDIKLNLPNTSTPAAPAAATATPALPAASFTEAQMLEEYGWFIGKRVGLTIEEARDVAKRALKFKLEKGRLPSVTSPDPWERRMAEGIAFLARMKAEGARG